MILQSARCMESIASHSTQCVTNNIDRVGDVLIQYIEPVQEPVWDERTTLVTRTYTNAAKRATGQTRMMTEQAISGVCVASSKCVEHVISTHVKKEKDWDASG